MREPTATQLARVAADYSRIAQEAVRVEWVTGALYVFASELACLRLLHKMPALRIGYSPNLRTWYAEIGAVPGRELTLPSVPPDPPADPSLRAGQRALSELEVIIARVHEGVRIQAEYYADDEGCTRRGLALHLIKVVTEEVLARPRAGEYFEVSCNDEVRELVEPYIETFLVNVHAAMMRRQIAAPLDHDLDTYRQPVQSSGPPHESHPTSRETPSVPSPSRGSRAP
jgi:hypothetical protein